MSTAKHPGQRPAGSGFERLTVGGCPVDSADWSQSVDWVCATIEGTQVRRHGFINASKVVRYHRDPQLRAALDGCDLLNADGKSIVWASRLGGPQVPERVNGTDLMFHMLGVAAERGYRVFLLGAAAAVVAKAAAKALAQYENLQICGSHHGYFGQSESDAVAAMVKRSRPNLVFVGMGTPKKELWMAEHADDIGCNLAIGVGGSFDILAGEKTRAPRLLQEAGLEWAWRLALEPGRMWRRYLIGNPMFIWHVVRDRLGSSRRQ